MEEGLANLNIADEEEDPVEAVRDDVIFGWGMGKVFAQQGYRWGVRKWRLVRPVLAGYSNEGGVGDEQVVKDSEDGNWIGMEVHGDKIRRNFGDYQTNLIY
ncbi:hypothetical protein GOBAR_DD09528 [Gossypium barbadense]|nr:hypothetical protein GOBAR_DD09528 [Gossypium barbadense]